MTAGAFGLTMVGIVLGLSGIPGWFALVRRTLFATDIGLVVVAPLIFFFAGDFLNDALHTGWGLVVYPFLVFVVCVALLYVRVFVLDRFADPRIGSLILFSATAIAALILGIVIPPLYE